VTEPAHGEPARFQDIPVPRRDIVSALLEEFTQHVEPADLDQLRGICELLVKIYHLEFHAELEQMKRAYAPFNPDLENENFDLSDMPVDQRAEQLSEHLRKVLERGNYECLTDGDLNRALTERSLFALDLVVDTSVYDEMVLYARGETVRKVDTPRWFGLSKKTMDVATFDRVCMFIRFKTIDQLKQERGGQIKPPRFDPGTTILKLFKNIPRADLEILFPNCSPQMRPIDKIFFGVPAVVGGIPVLAKLAPLAIALAVVLGLRNEEIDTASLVAGLTGLAVLGSYLFRQWGKFKNRRMLFIKELSENLYFRNLDNNEGVLTRLVDEAEEEECKEALLAYFFLLRHPEGADSKQLDDEVEKWLKDRFEISVDYEVSDGIAKLVNLGLVREQDGRHTVCPPTEGLAQLRKRWDALG
jgi:hypothetical protein